MKCIAVTGGLGDVFWSRVHGPTVIDGCWNWIAGRISTGYGCFVHNATRTNILAHRYAYMDLVGPIPAGLVIDHLCNNRICVNPGHLRLTTHRENILRGTGQSARNARKTHCKYGHPLDGPNLIIDHRDRRACRICKNIKRREEYWRNPEKARERTKLAQRRYRARQHE